MLFVRSHCWLKSEKVPAYSVSISLYHQSNRTYLFWLSSHFAQSLEDNKIVGSTGEKETETCNLMLSKFKVRKMFVFLAEGLELQCIFSHFYVCVCVCARTLFNHFKHEV